MVRSDRDHAIQLLEMADRDYRALTNMLDRQDFPEEVFGFHAQQVIEKTLKAWIAARSLTYPKSHDLSQLMRQLEGAGEDLSRFAGLEDYTIFAVQYRYEAYDEAEEHLDRASTVGFATALMAHVRGIVNKTS